MSVMRQDYPKDFTDDDPFTAALLDSCEIDTKTMIENTSKKEMN